MSVHSKMSMLYRWFLSLLRRVLSVPQAFARRSLKTLYAIWALLSRRNTRGGPSGGSLGGESAKPDVREQRLLDKPIDPPTEDDGVRGTVLASALPQAPPHTILLGSGHLTQSSSHPDLSSPERRTFGPVRPYSIAGASPTRSSPNVNSYDPTSLHPYAPHVDNGLQQGSLHPYGFASSNNSRSTQDFGFGSTMSRPVSRNSGAGPQNRRSMASLASHTSSRRSRVSSAGQRMFSNQPHSVEILPARASRAYSTSRPPSRLAASSVNSLHPASMLSSEADVVIDLIPPSRPQTPSLRSERSSSRRAPSTHSAPPSPASTHAVALPAPDVAPHPDDPRPDAPVEEERCLYAITPEWSERYLRERDMYVSGLDRPVKTLTLHSQTLEAGRICHSPATNEIRSHVRLLLR